jgi:hypothetical protein
MKAVVINHLLVLDHFGKECFQQTCSKNRRKSREKEAWSNAQEMLA